MTKKERLDEAKKKFMHLVEYTTTSSRMTTEDDMDPNAGGAPMGGDPGMGGAPMGGDPGMGGAPGGDPGMGGAPMGGDPGIGGDPGMGGAPGGDPGMSGDPGMGGAPGGDQGMGGGAQPPQGFQPQGVDQNSGIDGMGGENQGDMGQQSNSEVGPDDDVVEIDDLTDAQEDTEKKVDSLSSKFEKLLSSLDGIEKRINDIDAHTNQYIGVLKGEMAKRNPTPLQRLTMRSTKSSPYSMTPNEYMNNYAPENYSDEPDNNGADDPQYKITKGDVDDFVDYNSIAKEIANNKMGLKDIFDF